MTAATFTLTGDLEALFGSAVDRSVYAVASANVDNPTDDISYALANRVRSSGGEFSITLPADDAVNLPHDVGGPQFYFTVTTGTRTWIVPAQAAGSTHDVTEFSTAVPAPPSTTDTTIVDNIVAGRIAAGGSATQGAFDARVAVVTTKVATPEAYGAVGDGTTNDSAAVQAAIDSGLPVQLTAGKSYKCTGLVAKTGMLIRGAPTYPGGVYKATLKTTSGDLFTTPSSGTAYVLGVRIENIIVESSASSGGHLFRGMWSLTSFSNVVFVQLNNAKSIFDITGCIDVTFVDACLMQHTTTSTVSAVKMVSGTGELAQVNFGDTRCYQSGTHFFWIEGTSGSVPINFNFKNVNFEVCNGLAKLLSCRSFKFANCGAWDYSTGATNHLFHIDKSATSGAAPRRITFENCIRDASTAPTGGAQDIFVESTSSMSDLNILDCGHQLTGNYLVTAGNSTGRVRGVGITTLTTGLNMSADIWQATATPTISGSTSAVGNGTISGRIKRQGTKVDYKAKFVLGSTSVIGTSISISLPIAESGTGTGLLSLRVVGTDAGNNAYILNGSLATSTTIQIVIPGASGVTSLVTSTTPFTWGTGDSIEVSVSYETA